MPVVTRRWLFDIVLARCISKGRSQAYPLSVCNGSNACGDTTTDELPQEDVLDSLVSSGSKYEVHCVNWEELVAKTSKHKAGGQEGIDPRVQAADVQKRAEVSDVGLQQQALSSKHCYQGIAVKALLSEIAFGALLSEVAFRALLLQHSY